MLRKFSPQDVVRLGLGLRRLGEEASSLEVAGQQIVDYLYNHLINPKLGDRNCALIQYFQTLPTLPNAQVDSGDRIASTRRLNLLATVGDQADWHDRHHFDCYNLALEHPIHYEQVPILAHLLTLHQQAFLSKSPTDDQTDLIVEILDPDFYVFLLPEAENHPYLPYQTSWFTDNPIKSLLGCAGWLPSGDFFALVLFSKVTIPKTSMEPFGMLALSFKAAILRFGQESSQDRVSSGATGQLPDPQVLHQLQAQVNTLNQLLNTSEKSALRQLERSQRTIAQFQQRSQVLSQTLKELKQTDRALQESQAKFSRILQIAEDAIILVNSQKQIQLFNHGAEKIFGYRADEVINQSIDRLFPREVQADPLGISLSGEDLSMASRGDRAIIWGLRKTGETFSAEASISQFNLKDESLFTIILNDITDRLQAEEALRQSEAKNQAILTAIPDLMFRVSDEGIYLGYVNTSAMTDLLPQDYEPIGQHIGKFLPPEVAERHLQHLQQALQTGHIQMYEKQHVFDGRIQHEEVRVVPSGDREVLFMIRDVTDRKLMEAALREKNEELTIALQQLKTAQDELIHSEKMVALGQLIAGIAHELNTPLGAIRSSVDSMTKFLQDGLAQLPPLLQSLEPSAVDQFMALLRSSLQPKPALTAKEERKLRRALANHLEDQQIPNADGVADTLIDMGLYGDEVEPFLSLLQNVDNVTLLDTSYKLSGLHRSAQTIEIAAGRAAKVVFALKNYVHRDHAGQMTQANLTDGLETVLTLYQNLLKQGVEVLRHYDQVPPICCYPDELNQIWTNLIQNSLQAMQNRGTLIITVQQVGSHVQVSITDSGTGIPSEIKDKIFQPFFTTKPLGEGSGLGLDIVKKIIDKHRGTIEVESTPGQTTFTVSLPIDPQQLPSVVVSKAPLINPN